MGLIVGSSELPDDPAEVRAAIAMSQEAIAIAGCSIVNTMSTVIVLWFWIQFLFLIPKLFMDAFLMVVMVA